MKTLYVVLGFFFVALGGLGAFIPVLPTVPFLLLASFFFLRGSARFYNWFARTWLYKKYLKDYNEQRAMTLKNKFSILLPVSAILIVVMLLADSLVVRIILGCLMVIKYYFFFRHIDTIPAAEKNASSAQAKQSVYDDSNQ